MEKENKRKAEDIVKPLCMRLPANVIRRHAGVRSPPIDMCRWHTHERWGLALIDIVHRWYDRSWEALFDLAFKGSLSLGRYQFWNVIMWCRHSNFVTSDGTHCNVNYIPNRISSFWRTANVTHSSPRVDC